MISVNQGIGTSVQKKWRREAHDSYQRRREGSLGLEVFRGGDTMEDTMR